MTAPFSARRRADELEALLSGDPADPAAQPDPARYADLLRVVDDLRSVPPVAARPEFVASLRERLMAEADTALLRQPTAPARLAMPASSRTRQRRVGALLGGAALVGSAATMAVAAQTALPGESLYGVKRGIEAAELRLATDDADRGRTLLAQAATRLSELEELAADTGGREGLVPDTLDSFTRQSSDGVRSLLVSYEATGSIGDAQAARDFTSSSMARLERLQGELPESARDELVAAGRTLADLDLEVSTVCRACTGGITTTPDFLLSSAAQDDLLSGLDADLLTLEGAPISGQDLTGLTVPEALDPQQAAPSSTQPGTQPTALSTAQQTVPGPGTVSGVPDPTTTGPGKPDPTRPVKDITKGLTDTVTGTTDGVTDGVTGAVTDTTSTVTGQLDDATGGALGGLTSGADDATGGLIGEITGTVDGATGGLLGDATGGLLP